jgi:hypothetical protein
VAAWRRRHSKEGDDSGKSSRRSGRRNSAWVWIGEAGVGRTSADVSGAKEPGLLGSGFRHRRGRRERACCGDA